METFIWPDEEQPVKSAVRETALYGAGFFPIFRDVAIAAWNYADPDTQFFGYRASPAAGALEAIAKLPGAAIDIATGEGTKGDVKTMVMGGGYATGLPSLQLWRTFNHLDNVYSGDSDFNPWYLVMGEPFKR